MRAVARLPCLPGITFGDATPASPGTGSAFKRFMRDVAGDYKHFFSKETALWYGAGAATAGLVHLADEDIREALEDPSAGAAQALEGGNKYGNVTLQVPLAAGWWIVSHAAGSARGAQAGRDLLRAQISAASWTFAIKVVANRTRPNGDPRSFRGLVEALARRGAIGARVLFPCSSIAEATFPAGMRDAGAMVDVVHVYTTTPIWVDQPLQKHRLGQRLAVELTRGCVVTCASPSAARALVELSRDAGVFEPLRRTPIVDMGPTTAEIVTGLGLQAVDAGGRTLASMARRAVEIGRGRS